MFKLTSQSSADRSHDRFDSGQGNDVDFSHENFEEEFQIDAEDGDEETGDCLDLMLGCCWTRQKNKTGITVAN